MSMFLPLAIEIKSEKVTETSVMDLIIDSNGGIGWLINLALLAMFAYSMYIIFERFQALKRALREEEDFLSKIKGLLLEGNMEAARKYCANSESPSAKMLEKGIARIGKPIDTIAISIENTGKVEIIRLKRRMRFLIMTAGTAPLLGLFGTVVAMYGTFSILDNTVELNAMHLSHGSMIALITSVIGLFVGAISYAGYHFLLSKVERVTYQMEKDAIQFLDLLLQPGK
jgi:biopolymer transport protein ExbB